MFIESRPTSYVVGRKHYGFLKTQLAEYMQCFAWTQDNALLGYEI